MVASELEISVVERFGLCSQSVDMSVVVQAKIGYKCVHIGLVVALRIQHLIVRLGESLGAMDVHDTLMVSL